MRYKPDFHRRANWSGWEGCCFPADCRARAKAFRINPGCALFNELRDRVGRLTAAPPPIARIDGLLHLGDGVAFRVASPGLLDLGEELAEAFRGMLVPQDLAAPRLHIMVQNKVGATEARTLHRQLSAGFQPRSLRIAGIAAWHYRGGPWEPAFTRAFRG